MSILDEIKAADEQQRTSEMLEQLTSTLPAVEQQLTRLTARVKDLTSFAKVLGEVTSERLDRLSTTPQSAQPSATLDDATASRLTEMEKTLRAIASTLTHSQKVQLPNGETVTRSELDAYALMTRILQRLETTDTSSAELAEAVRKRGTIHVDTERLSAHAIAVLDKRLARSVAAPIARIEASIAGFEERVSTLGWQRAGEVSQEVDRVIDKAESVASAVRAAERRVDALAARVTWTTLGRLGLALVPLAAVLLVIGGLTMGAFHALGIGPLLGWAWSSFAAAPEWWAKTLIAAGALTGVAGFAWLTWFVARKLGDEYSRW